ncbi:ATP-dependent RNA helicase, partial [Coemansia sp. RSA 2320]
MRYSTPGRHTSSRRSDVSVRDIRSTYSIFRVDRGLLPESGTQLASSVLAACMANDLDVFVGCVLGASAGVPLSIRFNHGLTPLMVACKCGATQVVRWICQHDGAAVNSTDVHGNTALHLAAAAGYTLCVESLLSSGAAAARQNSEGVAPIHYAAYHGHKDTVLQVLRHSAAVTDQRDSSGKTPLMLAAFRGRTQAVSALLSSAASVNARDNAGWTALMYAAFTGRIVICRELLEYAANRTIVDYGSGKSAAVLAQDAGYYEVADMLLNKEALLRTPSLPEGIHMPAFSPVSRSATHSVKPAARMSQHTSFSSMLRPAIERALSPSLRRASRSINSQSRRAAYAAPLPLPLPPIPPAPVRHSRISATPRLTVPAETPAGLNIVLPSLHSVHRAASAATRVSNLAPIPEASNTEHTPIRAAHKAARARTTQTLTSTPAAISGGAAKPRRDPSLAPTHSVPEKQSTEIQLTPIAAKEALVKQTNKQPKRLTRKAVPKTAAHSLPGTTPAAAAAPKSNLTPIDGPPHTAIAMVPNKHRIQPPITPSGGWDQRATPAPLHGNAPKPPSIPDRIRDTISRASLKFHDVRTSQALKQENVATAATAFPAHLSHGNALSHTELGHATGAKYVNLGSVTHRRRKTASPTSRKAPPAADPYKRYHDSSWIRPYWNAFARIVTLWMPDFVLRILLRKETPGKRLAWREKIALCFIILLITAFTALISFGLSALFCHPVDPISLDALREKYGANGTQKLTVIRGRLYDVTDARHASSLGLTPLQFGSDASGMFAPFPDEAKKCAHWPPGKTSRNCYSVFGESPACGAMSRQKLDTLRQLETNKWIAYQWDDVLHGNGSGNLFVYNEFVYSLRPYLASTAAPGGDEYFGKDLTQTLRDLVGTDATIAVSRSRALQELVPCWDAQLRLGRIEGSTVGCVITSSITILVTVILNIMILIKLACAVLFDWAFSVQLTKITKHFIRGSNKRVPHVLITITCYDENEDTIRSTLDSIALTNYACSRKILFIIADGDVAATGDTRTTPQVLRGLINRSNPHEPVQPLPYIAVGEGPWAFNAAEVIPGSYVSLNGITVPCILIIKVGTKREREQNMPKAGNRGKRDSQLIILQWLRNVLLNDHLTPLEFELCRSASQLAKLNPDQFEYLLMVDADTSIDIECIPRLVAAMERDPGIMGL